MRQDTLSAKSGAAPKGWGACPPFAASPIPHLGSTEKKKISFLYNYNSHCFQGLTQSKAAHLLCLPVDTTSVIVE